MKNLNSCCYVEKIKEINLIPGADNIEQALIGGWNCIVKKNAYKVGDLVIVATTDAVIPKHLSDYLGVTNYLRSGQRVKTVKLRGVYSECMIIPTTLNMLQSRYLEVGDCMMETLNITKWEPPAKMIQLSSGRKIKYHENPNFLIYYKFPNAKNVPDMFNENDVVEVTRKIHGTNARYGIVKKKTVTLWDKIKKLFGNKWAEYEFVVGSHNVEKGSDSQGYYDTNVWYQINDTLNIKDKLWRLVKDLEDFMPSGIGSGLTIYGEIYGAGIQKNYDYGLRDHVRLCIFDATIDGEYLSTRTVRELTDLLDLYYVPVLYEGVYKKDIIDSFVYNNYIEGTKIPHEGVVVKSVTGDRHKVSKYINPDYLIYSEKNNVGDSH